jgi:hypothetical protein
MSSIAYKEIPVTLHAGMLRRVLSRSKNCAKGEQAYHMSPQTSDPITEQPSISNPEQKLCRQQTSGKTIVKPSELPSTLLRKYPHQSFVDNKASCRSLKRNVSVRFLTKYFLGCDFHL